MAYFQIFSVTGSYVLTDTPMPKQNTAPQLPRHGNHTNQKTDLFAPVDVDLRDPLVATFLAWLWPGAGHLYQQRYGKAILFMACILSIFFFGFAIGGGRVVYASWKKEDRRLPYLCQICIGAPALPALVQNYRVTRGRTALFNGVMAPPRHVNQEHRDELAEWHEKYQFELGTVFTMIAGLLNVLAIYDAGAGPVFTPPDTKRDKPPPPEVNDR